MAKKINLNINEIKRLYCEEHLFIKDIAKIFNVSGSKIKRELVNAGVEIRKQNPFTDPEVKNRIKQTMINKYGVENASQIKEVQEKHKENKDIINEKRKQTMLKRYGVENANYIKDIRDKMTQNLVNTLSKKSYKSIIKEISNKDNCKTYINEFSMKLNRKPTLLEICKDLNLNGNTALRYIRLYGLEDLIERKQSGLELSLEDFIKALNIEFIKHDRTQIKPQELDFYFPNEKVAIEFNDIASHNSTRGYYNSAPTPKSYHVDKSKRCEAQGIRLIHVWEYEWFNERQRPILENIIKNALGLCDNKIYARKCKIKVINRTADLREFFDNNNIQGFRPGKFAICLEYNDEIVMSYIFGHCYFGKGKYECEVIRGATKLNYNVIGRS